MLSDDDKKFVGLENTWAPIPGYEGLYEVSKDGWVCSFQRRWLEPRLLVARPTVAGYLYVGLTKGGSLKNRFVHRLVLLAFVGKNPKGTEAAHLDGDKTNNSLKNLRWVSKAENEKHKEKHGTLVAGERHPRCRLPAELVACIKRDAKAGLTHTQLSRKYKYARSGIAAILKGRSRRHG